MLCGLVMKLGPFFFLGFPFLCWSAILIFFLLLYLVQVLDDRCILVMWKGYSLKLNLAFRVLYIFELIVFIVEV